MPWPSDYVQVQVAGTFKDALQNPLKGYVSFEPSQMLVDELGHNIIPPAITGIELVNGSFQTYLLATDEPRVSPKNWYYNVTISIKGGTTLKLSVPSEMAGSVLYLDAIIASQLPPPGDPIMPGYATVGMVQAEQASRIAADALLIPLTQKGVAGGVATLDSGGKVPASQIDNADFVLASEKGAPSGVATLGADGIVPVTQLPPPVVHTQGVAATTWTIPYTYSAVPDVTVYDNNDDVIIADVDTTTAGQVIIRTYFPETGKAILRW